MRPFDFFKPDDLREVLGLLEALAPEVRVLAGGTDYLVELKHAVDTPSNIVDVSQLPELKGIEEISDGLRIGAGVTHTELMTHPLIEKYAPAMIHAAHTIGAVQTRNLGTLGGNLVTCVPSMDSGPTLVALDAEVIIASLDESRRMLLTEFFVGPRKTVLRPHELLIDIVIPKRNFGKPTNFHKFGLRKGQALSLVNVASSLWVENGIFKDVRISLGAVAPVVIRCPKAEGVIEGQRVNEETIGEAGRTAVSEAKPIDDFRASKEYRKELINVLTRRTLEAAVEIANNS